MATQPTNLPVPSESPRDLKFNTGKIDEFVTSSGWTYTDRFGNKHYTIEGLRWIAQQAIASYGYITMDSFEEGNTLTLPNQVLRLEANGEYYRWDGAFPKSVPENSTPESTGGIGAGAWLSVGDATLRGQISDPDGATLYPELQFARWRDDGDARGWGVFPDGTDVTAKMCAWLDAVNGDYSKLVQYGQYRNRGYLPPGDYVVSATNLTGNHALLGRMVIRCNMVWEGRVPNGEFTLLHVKGLTIDGISCKNLIAQGIQHCRVVRVDTTGDITLKGSTTPMIIPGIVSWGGGSYWNEFSNIKSGNTSDGGSVILNIYEGSVNHNTFIQTSCAGVKILGERAGAECYENTFVSVDTAGTSDYILDNQTSINQKNNVIGLHCEVTGNGQVRGNWNISSYRVQYGNMASTLSHMNSVVGSEHKSNQQGGDFISMSGVNLCPSGDWSVINNSGFPIDYGNNNVIPSEFVLFSDANEPSGSGRCYGVSNASVRARIYVNLTRTLTGYIRGAFFFRGDTPVEITIESTDGLEANSFYQDPTKFFTLKNSWKIYKVAAPTLDANKSYRLRITVEAGKSGLIGGSYFSAYNATVLPTFCGWSKSSGRHNVAPNYNGAPIGFIFYRTSATAYPSDPVYAWVHRGGGAYGTINVVS